MKKLSKINIFLIIAVILNIFLVFANFFVYRISIKKQQGLDDLRGQIFKTEKQKENFNSLKHWFESFEKEKNKIEAVFLREKNIVRFIEQLEELAKISKTDIEFQSAEIPIFLFNLEGPFEDLIRFLVLLENLPFQIEIQDLNLAGREKEVSSQETPWQARFKIKVLSYFPV